jgi:hypothetical protein
MNRSLPVLLRKTVLSALLCGLAVALAVSPVPAQYREQ